MRADGELFGGPRTGSPEAVRFLTALLVSMPQVGAVQLTDGGGTLVLEFFLGRRLETSRLREFARELREAHEVFARLKGFKPSLLRVLRGGTPRTAGSFESMETSEDWQERPDSLQVLRDVQTLSPEDLSLVVALVEEEFERDLEVGEDFEDEDDGYHEEILESSLDQIRFEGQEVDLVGFRDEMRVLVYASDEEGPRRRTSRP